MKVEQLMTRILETITPGDSLAAAARIMWERDCGRVPVVASADDGGRRLVGMVTDRDVCMAAWTQGRPLADVAVARRRERTRARTRRVGFEDVGATLAAIDQPRAPAREVVAA
jgi:CBS domain-containing protein